MLPFVSPSVSTLREAPLPLLVVALHAVLLGCILMSFFLLCYHAHSIQRSSSSVDSTPQVLSHPLSLTHSPSTALWRAGHLAPELQQSSFWISKVPLIPPTYPRIQSVAKRQSSTLSLLTLGRSLAAPSGHWNSAPAHRALTCRSLPSWEPQPWPQTRCVLSVLTDVLLDPTRAKLLWAFLPTKPQPWPIRNAESQRRWFHPLIPPKSKDRNKHERSF